MHPRPWMVSQAPQIQYLNNAKFYLDKFRKEMSTVSPPPQNNRCLNLAQALNKYNENQGDPNHKQKLKQCVSQLNRIEDVPKSKGKLCGGLLQKNDKAYKCYDCMTEQNSVLCPQCFQLDKHIGHEFERFQVYGGCCDCGDIEKWKEQGFCHQHSKKQQTEIILDQKLTDLFIQEQTYVLKTVLELYKKYLHFKQLVEKQDWQQLKLPRQRQMIRQQFLKWIKQQLQFYGEICMNQLLNFNKAGIYANTMTGLFFETKLENKKVLEHLFTMTQSQRIAHKVSDICITMFPLEGFRETVTQLYINFYNSNPKFPPSQYSHLSSQLLTSHMAITKLVKEKRIQAIRYKPECPNFQSVAKICDGYLRYYYDIRYLSKLYGSAAVDYYKFFAKQEMFSSLGYYRVLFDGFSQAVDYYGLEQIFLDRMIRLIKVIQRDTTLEISDLVLKQLYSFITSQHTSEHNKFRPQERLFALVLLVRLDGDIFKLEDPEYMQQIIQILGVNNFKEQMKTLLTNLRSIFLTASKLLQSMNQVHSKYTFYSFYMKKSHLLFNCDAFLFKVVLRFCDYYCQNYEKFDYEQILVQGINNPIKIIQIAQKDDQQFNQQHSEKIVFSIKHLKSYISILFQAMFSDLSELSLMCALQPTDFQVLKKYQIKKLPTQKLADHYYKCLLRSQQSKRVPIKQFKKLAQLFFKEEETFKKFVTQHKDPEDNLKLVRIEDGGSKMHYHYHKSISILQPEKYRRGFGQPPYMRLKNNQVLLIFVEPIQLAIRSAKNINKQSQIISIAFVGDLVVELCKILKATGSQKISKLLSKTVKDDQLSKQLQNLSPEILSLLTSQDNQVQNNESKQQKKQEMKRKLIQKKMKIKEKMKGNTQRTLEKMQAQEPIFELQQSMLVTPSKISENLSNQQCCLCKETSSEEALHLQTLVTFTTGNGWLGIDHQKNVIPLFSSCGHAVHMSCNRNMRKKIQANRVYSYCHLCKSASNILLPQTQVLEQKEIFNFTQSLAYIYQTLDMQFDIQKVPQNICKSIEFQLLTKGIIQEPQFKKIVKSYAIILNIYFSLHKNLGLDHKVNNTGCIECYADTPEKLKSMINYVSTNINGHPQSFGLSQNFELLTVYLIGLLKNQKHPNLTTQIPPEVSLIHSTIVFPKLQQNLASLNSKYRGKCPQCGLVTNNQLICLSCPNFITCYNCSKVKITDHCAKYHCGIAVLTKTSTGQLVYLMRNRSWKFQSLYEDYMGRHYRQSSKHRQEYNLNMNKYFQTQKDILCCKIEQKVRYKQVVTKSVHNSDIY